MKSVGPIIHSSGAGLSARCTHMQHHLPPAALGPDREHGNAPQLVGGVAFHHFTRHVRAEDPAQRPLRGTHTQLRLDQQPGWEVKWAGSIGESATVDLDSLLDAYPFTDSALFARLAR